MTKEQKRDALARFGLQVLKQMEADKDWGADLLGAIHSEAMAENLATMSNGGYFVRTRAFKRVELNNDFYTAPQVGL